MSAILDWGKLIMTIIIQWGFAVIIIAMIVRMVASWFRLDERYAIIRFCARLTDPYILPLRRIIRPVGFLDLSFIIAFVLLLTLRQLLLQAL
ncbi:MAG TPA: YggT family protein [Ktedonosporobacter sp.]|nr:YggT family protein [Ktedonosporobacter sp.]